MIGGNTTVTLQAKTTTKNAIGEKVSNWTDVKTIRGYLDYTGGDASHKTDFKGGIEETTHIFICDFITLDVKPTQCRLVSDHKVYDVLMIDDPMDLHQHLEIFLKYNEAVTNG